MHEDFESIIDLKIKFKDLSSKAKKVFLATGGRGAFSREGVAYLIGDKVPKYILQELIDNNMVEIGIIADGILYYEVTDHGKEIYKVI